MLPSTHPPCKSSAAQHRLITVLAVLSLLMAVFSPVQGQNAVDSLKKLLSTATSDTAIARLENKIGTAYFYSDMDSALFWWKKAMEMGEHLALSEDSAFREKGQRIIMSSANNSAVVAHYRGLYPLALRNHQRSITIALALKDLRGITNSVNNIGLIKKEQGKFKDALAHFETANRLAIQLNDSQTIGSTLNNIGTAYIKLQQDSIALRYFKRSLIYSILTGDQVQEVDNRINIGSILLEVDEPDSALQILRLADSIAIAIEYEIGRPEILLGIAKALQATGQRKEALIAIHAAIDLSKELEITEVTVESLEALAVIETADGLHAQANKTLMEYIQLKDSLINSDKLLEFGQLEANFAYEREEYESALAAEQKAAEIRDAQFRQYITAFAAMCGFVLLMLFAMRWVHNPAVVKICVFAALLFFFEFMLVLLDSMIDGMTGGLPMPKLVVNIALAALIAPAHTVLESWLMRHRRDAGGTHHLPDSQQ